MKKYKKIIIIAAIIALPILAVICFKLLIDFRRSNLYVEFPGISVDGKSFYIKRIYNCDGRTMSPNQDIILEIRNYTSSSNQPEILLNRKSDSFSFMDVNEAVEDNEIYLNITAYKGISGQSIAENTLTKYAKNGISQSAILPNNCYGMYSTPCNLIIMDSNTGFYSSEPFKKIRTFLCSYPPVKDDAKALLLWRHPEIKEKGPNISIRQPRIHTVSKPICFVMAVFCEKPSVDSFPLIYIFQPDTKQLINISTYLTKADEDKLMSGETPDISVIQESTKVKISDELNKNKQYPDFMEDYFGNNRVEILQNNSIFLHRSGGSKIFINPSLQQNENISSAFFFKPDNVIIAQVSIDNHSFGPGYLTEVAAIDPATGDTRIISPLCPAEQKKNDPYYTFLFNLSDNAYKLRAKMPESVRKTF